MKKIFILPLFASCLLIGLSTGLRGMDEGVLIDRIEQFRNELAFEEFNFYGFGSRARNIAVPVLEFSLRRLTGLIDRADYDLREYADQTLEIKGALVNAEDEFFEIINQARDLQQKIRNRLRELDADDEEEVNGES